MKLMIYMQFIPFSPETFFFSFEGEGGGGLERFVISSVYVGLKAGLLQSFPVFYIRYTFPRLYFHLIFIL